MKTTKKVKSIKAWGGFSGGKPAFWDGAPYGWEYEPRLRAIFTRKYEAKERFDDVRPVMIIWK